MINNNMNFNKKNPKSQIVSFDNDCQLIDERDEAAIALYEMFGSDSDDFFEFYDEFTKKDTSESIDTGENTSFFHKDKDQN
ncbi:MAG: hypothetical protein R3Y63_04490 [Eubacteriales bacterium]